MAWVTGGAGCEGPADASFIGPALTWTVLTLTGFIGSAEPGIARNLLGLDDAAGQRGGFGPGLRLEPARFGLAAAGRAAAAAAISDGLAGAIERVMGGAASAGSADRGGAGPEPSRLQPLQQRRRPGCVR